VDLPPPSEEAVLSLKLAILFEIFTLLIVNLRGLIRNCWKEYYMV